MTVSIGLLEENDCCMISVEIESFGEVQQIIVECSGWSTESGDSSERQKCLAGGKMLLCDQQSGK